MGEPAALSFSGRRWSVTYHLAGSLSDARTLADLLCIEQTVECADRVIPPGVIREQLIGQVASFRRLDAGCCEAVLTFPVELLDESIGSLLHVAYGTASLRRGVRITDIHIPELDLSRWCGPRFGTSGIRKLMDVADRPLVCAVLKPLGLSPPELADLARDFALGGVDIIKDDQGLGDHPFCRFAERVSRCAEAVAEASVKTGKRSLYAPHITGAMSRMLQQAEQAQRVGAGALLLCPGIVGFEQIAEFARHTAFTFAILSHPALIGTYYVSPDQGVAPSVLFGLIPRIAGADISIYPTYGLDYPMTSADCGNIAATCLRPLGHLAPIFPTAAGRMGSGRIREMTAIYGKDVVYVLGSDLCSDRSKVCENSRSFIEDLMKD
jgi:ribulose-bisphosphate carboxylase large chain